MSKYTAERVLYAAQLEEDTYDGDLIIVQYLRDYAALLRERESAKAVRMDADLHDRIEFALRDADFSLSEASVLAQQAVAPVLASVQVPDGWMLVPKMFGIPADAWHAAQFAFGGPGTRDDEPFMDCTAWIGELTGDEGEKIQGLHIWCDECPEEGSITLAEFPAAPKPETEE